LDVKLVLQIANARLRINQGGVQGLLSDECSSPDYGKWENRCGHKRVLCIALLTFQKNALIGAMIRTKISWHSQQAALIAKKENPGRFADRPGAIHLGSIAGKFSIHARRSSTTIKVRRPRLTARSSPELIAAYKEVRPTRPIEHASAIVRAKGVILTSHQCSSRMPRRRSPSAQRTLFEKQFLVTW
jgi:hypothetical protein